MDLHSWGYVLYGLPLPDRRCGCSEASMDLHSGGPAFVGVRSVWAPFA